MKRSTYPSKSVSRAALTMFGQIVGAGAADPTVPTTQPEDQAIASATRTGVGAHTIVLKEDLAVPRRLAIIPVVVGPDGKRVQEISYTVATRTLLIQAYNAAGAAAELAATDTVNFVFHARETLS